MDAFYSLLTLASSFLSQPWLVSFESLVVPVVWVRSLKGTLCIGYNHIWIPNLLKTIVATDSVVMLSCLVCNLEVLEVASLALWEAERAKRLWVKLDLWPRLGGSRSLPGRALSGQHFLLLPWETLPIFPLHWLTSDTPGLYLFPTEVNKHSWYVKIKGPWPLQVPWSVFVQN